MKNFCLVVLLAGSITLLHSQNFEGVVTAKLEALELPAEAKGMEAMFNNEVTVYTSKGKSRMEMKTMMGPMIILVDSSAKEMITCMDYMGQKTALVSPIDDSKPATGQFNFRDGSFTTTPETKTIAGHPCKKAIWKSNDTNNKSEIEMWYATDIPLQSDQYKGLPGMPMEYIFSQEQIKMKYTVIDVKAQKVDPAMLAIPAGYVRKTAEELGIPGAGKK